jgi:hypothetical protein
MLGNVESPRVTYVGKDPGADWPILKMKELSPCEQSVSIYWSTYLSKSLNIQQDSLK